LGQRIGDTDAANAAVGDLPTDKKVIGRRGGAAAGPWPSRMLFVDRLVKLGLRTAGGAYGWDCASL
jgi:hypothetical protein